MEIAAISIVVPLLIGIWIFRKLRSPARLLVLLILITALLDVTSRLLGNYSVNNLALFHVHTYVEFALIYFIYHLILPERWNVLLFIGGMIFVCFSVLNLIMWEPFTAFNSYQRFAESILLIIPLYAYLNEITHSGIVRIDRHPYFILTVGLLLYFVGTSFLFLFSNHLFKINDGSYWIIHSIFNVFLNGTYTLVVWKTNRLSELL